MEKESKQLHYAGVLTGLIACAFLLAARLIYLYIADPYRFPINTVKIEAAYQHISHQQLESILGEFLDTSFFTLPMGRLQTRINELEWVESVQLERIWPDSLKISLIEKTPIATWNDGLLTANAEVFNEGRAATAELSSMPHLSGPINQQQEVLQVYQKMSKILSMYGLVVASLELRKNHAWEMGLANGVQLRLGKRDLETRITRFCKAYPAVFADRVEQLASVDLRYPRGMAVQWKK